MAQLVASRAATCSGVGDGSGVAREPAPAAASDEPTPLPSEANPATTPIPEEPSPVLLAQREWYDSQDKIFRGPIPPETPWQDDDLSAQPSSSASEQPMVNEAHTEPPAPDQEPWLLPKPDTRLFNIFGESFELQALKEKIAKGQMPHCLFKDPAGVDQQPLNRQEMWAAMQYKPIHRTAGRWTYWELLPDDIRKPPPQFCNEIEDAPKQPPASRSQPKEKARPKHVPPSARPSLPPKQLRKTPEQMPHNRSRAHTPSSKPQPVQDPKATTAAEDPTGPAAASTAGHKSEPPPQQHLRPPESQTFLPKEAQPQTKAMPTKPPQPSQGQPAPPDRPGSSNDGIQDLSSADPATVYMPQPGQDLDIAAFRALDQPGASTPPYLFDIGLLDRRAQPLYSHPHYKPIECMIFDRRPWICFYGGSPPTVVAETDDWWYTMIASDGGCCLQGWPIFLLQDFVRLFADPPPSPQPTTQADDAAADAASEHPGDFLRRAVPPLSQLSPIFWEVLAPRMRGGSQPSLHGPTLPTAYSTDWAGHAA